VFGAGVRIRVRVRVRHLAMIAVPAKAITRIYPQMSQMFTDEEKHLCSSVFICGSAFRPTAAAEADRACQFLLRIDQARRPR
jgi:hypothetical protein